MDWGVRLEVPKILFVVGLIAAGTSPVSGQVELGVITFNIRTSNGLDGENAWPLRKELVVETIERFTPDVLSLQEALDEQVEYLDAMLPEYRWLGIDRGLNGGVELSEYTPIFYRYSELSPIESGNFWLTSTPDTPPAREDGSRRRGGGRIVTWARFHHHATSRQIYVFNTHFTLRRGQRQIDSAELITTKVESLPVNSAVIVTGDFNNSAEDSDTWRIMTGRGLRDAWVLADEKRGPAVTYGGFSAPGDELPERVDWILVGRRVDVNWIETVLHNDDGRYPSDHYPVVASLEIR